MEWVNKFTRPFNIFENNPSLKNDVETKIERVYQVTAEEIKK